MTQPSVEDLRRAFAAVGALISDIGQDMCGSPTPCSEWSVRDVVEHLVAMNLVFTALLEGGPTPERGTDRLGDNPAGAYQASAATLVKAFGWPGVMERSFPGVLGTATGAERLQIRLYDLLAHGWDLAQATGNAADLPVDLAPAALAFVHDQLSTQPRTGRFAEPQPVSDTAPAIDKLAAVLGRTVS